MPYVITLFRGADPAAPEATLVRAEIEQALADSPHASQTGSGAWRYDDGQLVFPIELPRDEPGSELRLLGSWSRSDQLATLLTFAVGLAERLSARVWDRQAGSPVTLERVTTLSSAGGFAPAAPGRPWWRFWDRSHEAPDGR